jgi:hypothetical protein
VVRLVSIASLLVVGAAIALVALWFVMTVLAGDGCAWIAGFGGCR